MSKITFSIEQPELDISFSIEQPELDISFRAPIIREAASYDEYDGPITVVPGQKAVVLRTVDKHVSDNITVGPIPQNYGLVTWNGSYLTIS